jgi:hypothetical protein
MCTGSQHRITGITSTQLESTVHFLHAKDTTKSIINLTKQPKRKLLGSIVMETTIVIGMEKQPWVHWEQQKLELLLLLL